MTLIVVFLSLCILWLDSFNTWSHSKLYNNKMVAVRRCYHKKAPICLYSYVEGIEYIDSMASSMCCHRVYIRQLQIHKLLTKLTKTIA